MGITKSKTVVSCDRCNKEIGSYDDPPKIKSINTIGGNDKWEYSKWDVCVGFSCYGVSDGYLCKECRLKILKAALRALEANESNYTYPPEE